MNQKKAIYVLFSLVIALILFNIAMVVYLYIFQIPRMSSHCEERGGRGRYLIESLELNEEQEIKFEALRNEHLFLVEPINDEIRKKKNHFFSLIKEEKTDSLAIDSLSKEITELHRRIDIATFFHFKKIREICNSSQQKKFDELIHDGLFAPEMGKGHGRNFKNQIKE